PSFRLELEQRERATAGADHETTGVGSEDPARLAAGWMRRAGGPVDLEPPAIERREGRRRRRERADLALELHGGAAPVEPAVLCLDARGVGHARRRLRRRAERALAKTVERGPDRPGAERCEPRRQAAARLVRR